MSNPSTDTPGEQSTGAGNAGIVDSPLHPLAVVIRRLLTPSEKAIAGDYQTTIRAGAAGGLSESSNFRITVLTSTLWGAVGIAIIALSLLVVVFAVARFGRR